MSSCDDFVTEICAEVAERLSATGLPGEDLRERKHLDPYVKDAIAARSGIRPVSKKFVSDAFVGLGAVDVVVDRPRLFMELKWSYERPGKVFESVWDAIKLAILGSQHRRDQLYIATGASQEEWARSESADLFRSGPVEPLAMWQRPLVPKRGPNYGATVGEDLVIGGRGNQPRLGPHSLEVRLLGTFLVGSSFALKLATIERIGDLRPWPQVNLAGA
jgi:hypothetical protein